MSYQSAHQLQEANPASSSSEEHIDPLNQAPVPLYDQRAKHPADQISYDPTHENQMSRPRLRSVSSRGSKVSRPVNEQTITEDEVFQPVSQPELDSGDDNKNAEIVNAWYNMWGLSQYGSQILENKASVARDHMANERTFLSWMRTSLGLATAGVSVTQLFKIADQDDDNSFLVRVGKPIGAAFISIAILCILMGMMRFFKTQTLLQEDRYPAARVSASILVFLVFSICVVTLVAVLYSA